MRIKGIYEDLFEKIDKQKELDAEREFYERTAIQDQFNTDIEVININGVMIPVF